MPGMAKDIFAKLTAGGGEGGKENGGGSSNMTPGAIAGKRFAEAVSGGDGAKIYSAFKALKEECEGEEMSSGGEEEAEGLYTEDNE